MPLVTAAGMAIVNDRAMNKGWKSSLAVAMPAYELGSQSDKTNDKVTGAISKLLRAASTAVRPQVLLTGASPLARPAFSTG